MSTYERVLDEIQDFIFVEDKPEKADIIFVPGNGYPHMSERAAELYREGLAPYVLPSGKYSITEKKFSGVLKKRECYRKNYQTEWEFLRDVLIKNQVPPEAILTEDQAGYTYENARFSKKVTDTAGLEIKKAILCCKSYHARRSLMYYQYVYPETQFLVVPCIVDGISKESWRDTESGVDAVIGEMTRIIKQFSFMM